MRGPPSGRRPRDHRLVLDGIFWIARTGTQWRDLPNFFGRRWSVYRQFRRRTLAGLWDLLLEVLNDTEGVGETIQMTGSTIIRAHHCAVGAKGGFRDGVWGAREVGFQPKFTLYQRRRPARSHRYRARPSLRLDRRSASPRCRRAGVEGSATPLDLSRQASQTRS
ncbi:transposase [Xanthobacter autotrophicus]|uniref:transposase n=1 Tax=Xanthobacter autotrophicus TaxID=280 RepID=UPI00372D310B